MHQKMSGKVSKTTKTTKGQAAVHKKCQTVKGSVTD